MPLERAKRHTRNSKETGAGKARRGEGRGEVKKVGGTVGEWNV